MALTNGTGTTSAVKLRTQSSSSNRRAGLPQIALLLAGTSMPVLGTVLLAPVLPSIAAHFQAESMVTILVPLVLTAPALAMALLSPFAGFFADRIGRKRILIYALIAYAFFGTAPIWINSLGGIVLSRVGVGVAEAFIMTVCTTLILDYYKGEQRSKYLGVQAMLGPIAAAVFMTLGGILGVGSWRVPFWAYAVALPLAVLMIIFIWEPTESFETLEKKPVPWKIIGIPVAVSLLGGILFYTLIVHLPFLVTELGLQDPKVIGLTVAIPSLATAAGSFLFRWTVRLGPAKVLPVAFALLAVGLGIVAFAGSVPVAVLGGVIAGVGSGVLLPTLLFWAVSSLDFEERGRGTGIWNAAFWSGQFLTPLVVAGAAAMVGGLQAGLGVMGVVALLASIIAATVFSAAKR